jgi:type VI secretion system protein ImpB
MPKKESLQHKSTACDRRAFKSLTTWKSAARLKLKELPFVVGVMGDFVGKPEEPLPALKNRKFVEIDRDNFNQVMAGMKPRSLITSITSCKTTAAKSASI